MKRFEGVRKREVAKMAKTIEELDITTKGEAIMLMVAVTRFTVRRSGTLSKSGSGKWIHEAQTIDPSWMCYLQQLVLPQC